MTYIIRLVRAEMMEILQTDYIKFARARGISEKSIQYKHALKNGLIPVITIAGIKIIIFPCAIIQYEIKQPATNNLSAMGSIIRPKPLSNFHFRAIYPSRKSDIKAYARQE